MHCVLRKTLCTTSSVSERGDKDSENHSVVTRIISIKNGNINGYIKKAYDQYNEWVKRYEWKHITCFLNKNCSVNSPHASMGK